MNPREWLSTKLSELAAAICIGTQPLEEKIDADEIKMIVGNLIDEVKQMLGEDDD